MPTGWDGKPRTSPRGFTLTNLVVSVGIVIVFGTLTLSIVSTAQKSAASARCLANLHAISLGFSQYASDNDCYYPFPFANGRSWESCIEPYIRVPGVFECPADSEMYPSVGSSYDWRDTSDPMSTLAGHRFIEPIRPDAVLAFETLPGWHGPHLINAVLFNGSVQTMNDEACLADVQSTPLYGTPSQVVSPVAFNETSAMRILVAEDHDTLGRSIANGLREDGFAVDLTSNGEEALQLSQKYAYDCLVLDVMLPRRDGWSIVEQVRGGGAKTPILMLTARDAIADRVKGLNLGADDYLVKPFAWDELAARVRALVRRGHGQKSSSIQIADLEIDTNAKVVRRGGKPITLSAKEYALLELLAHRAGAVLSRGEIWDHLYDQVDEPSSNVVDVYIGYLRNKIDRDFPVKLIHTRRGLGYVLAEMET